MPPSDERAELRAAVAQVRAQPSAINELKRIYAEADAAVARIGGVDCRACGRCCNFREAGHRLYVSTLELAYLSEQPPPTLAAAHDLRCPYQHGTQCMARERRALGCRTFFCNTFQESQKMELHEALHGRIRRVHEMFCVPYSYADVCTLLMQFAAVP